MNRFPPNLGCGCFSSCSINTWYPKHWNPKKVFGDVITSVLYRLSNSWESWDSAQNMFNLGLGCSSPLIHFEKKNYVNPLTSAYLLSSAEPLLLLLFWCRWSQIRHIHSWKEITFSFQILILYKNFVILCRIINSYERNSYFWDNNKMLRKSSQREKNGFVSPTFFKKRFVPRNYFKKIAIIAKKVVLIYNHTTGALNWTKSILWDLCEQYIDLITTEMDRLEFSRLYLLHLQFVCTTVHVPIPWNGMGVIKCVVTVTVLPALNNSEYTVTVQSLCNHCT